MDPITASLLLKTRRTFLQSSALGIGASALTALLSGDAVAESATGPKS